MEDMENDYIVDVPDTPDRSNTRNNDRKCVGNPEKREWAFPVANEISNCSNYITVSPPDKSYPSQNGGIFRKGQTEKVIGLGTTHSSGVERKDKGKAISFRFPSKQSHHETHSSGAERMEKGKTISSRFPSKQTHHERFSVLNLTEENGQFQQPKPAFSHCGSRDDAIECKKEFSNFPSKQSPHGRISFLDLTEENGQFQQPQPSFSHRGSRDNAIEDRKELKASIGNSSLPSITDSSNTSRNAFAGKCTLDSKTLPGPNIFMDRGKSISMSNDNQPQSTTEKQVSLPPRFSAAPRGRGHRRLVRNGCISPQNIAARAKQSAEQSNLQTNYVEQSHAGHSVSSNTMSLINVDDIVAEERDKSRVKGKGVLIHPSSHGINVGATHTHNSSPVIDCEEANGSSSATRNLLENFEGQGGWRTTHSEKNADQHSYDANGHHSRRNYNVGRLINRHNMNRMDRSGTGSSQNNNNVSGSLSADSPQPTSLIIPDVDQSTRPHPTAASLTKRQRKRESSSGNPIEASHNSEIIFLNSPGESSSSSRSRVLDPELVNLLSTPRFTNRLSEDLDNNDNNSLDARARQLEADEMLARELQEQLYRDDIFEGGGIDDHLTWELQHTEDLLHTSTNSHNTSHPTRLPRANRQPRSRPHQNPSNRRRTVPHVPFSNRMSQLRSRMINRPSTPTTSFRGRRRPRFPLDIDLDMRLDILEALEDAVGDFNDMGMADDIFNAHRDFNEYDYEMLLALDDQNHQHTGASANQINNLPQSTIQTDNFTDACCICLETPAMGEVIRHLPCLHKFHKDCIDPWLQRKSSCPVCKSSIT